MTIIHTTVGTNLSKLHRERKEWLCASNIAISTTVKAVCIGKRELVRDNCDAINQCRKTFPQINKHSDETANEE